MALDNNLSVKMAKQLVKNLTEQIANLFARLSAWIGPNLRRYIDSRQPQVWILAFIAGCAVAAGAICFRELIGQVQFLWSGTRRETLRDTIAALPWYSVFIGPVIGGLAVGLCLEFFLSAKRTASVADVIEAKNIGTRRLGFSQAILSALVTALSLGSGASAGREGPVVHLGAATSVAIARWLKLPDWGHKTLLACGVAGAISASFNAPIAGVLFAHEVILGHYAMRAFAPIVIASVTATVLSRLWLGNIAAFAIPSYNIASLWEFPAFLLLGVVCALVAIIFQYLLMAGDNTARRLPIPLFLRPAIGGALIGAIALAFPEILGVGYEATDMALKSQLPLYMLIGLLFAKTAATVITLASRFGGGIFSPALYLGAMTGGAFGLIAAGAFPQLASSEGLYAILGMGAVAAATLGAPLSTSVMVFELTGGYALSIALLLTVSVANGLTQAIHGHSFFHWQLERRGLFLQDGPQQTLLKLKRVEEFMTPLGEDDEAVFEKAENSIFLKPSYTLEFALRAFDRGGYTVLPVIDDRDETRIVGMAHQVKALVFFNKALVAAAAEEHQH